MERYTSDQELDSFLAAVPLRIHATQGAKVTINSVSIQIISREEDTLRKMAALIEAASGKVKTI